MTTTDDPQPTSPLWQMDLRHKLEIAPDMHDTVSRLLIAHIYGSEDQDEVGERLEYDIDALKRALQIVRGK